MWMDTINRCLSFFRDSAAALAILGTVVFFISPGFERWLAERFGLQAWYFAVELDIKPGENQISVTQGRNNFYHFLWAPEHDFTGFKGATGAEALQAFNSVLERMEGQMVYAQDVNRDSPTLGRKTEKVSSPAVTLAKAGDCFRILDSKIVVTKHRFPHNVYLKLVRIPCL
ncbi:MAG: hypothetical protein AAF393_16650 [Pseudomonadota bacterium]